MTGVKMILHGSAFLQLFLIQAVNPFGIPICNHFTTFLEVTTPYV